MRNFNSIYYYDFKSKYYFLIIIEVKLILLEKILDTMVFDFNSM